MRSAMGSYGTALTLIVIGSTLLRITTAQGLIDKWSFEDRLQMYSDWTSQLESKGRGLAWAPESSPASPPPPSPSSDKTPPPPPPPSPSSSTGTVTTSGGQSVYSVVSQPASAATNMAIVVQNGVTTVLPIVVQSTGSASTTSSSSSSVTSSGTCKVLRYQAQTDAGYVNLTTPYYKVIANVQNFGVCCQLCNADSDCQSWTRVAGGGDFSTFQNCYLQSNIYQADPSPDAYTNNVVSGLDSSYSPALRYVSDTYPTIFESGTVPDEFPAEYYGCPYNDVATTPCAAPSGCNINAQGQQVGGACIG